MGFPVITSAATGIFEFSGFTTFLIFCDHLDVMGRVMVVDMYISTCDLSTGRGEVV